MEYSGGEKIRTHLFSITAQKEINFYFLPLKADVLLQYCGKMMRAEVHCELTIV
jgi:hypothetical protein